MLLIAPQDSYILYRNLSLFMVIKAQRDNGNRITKKLDLALSNYYDFIYKEQYNKVVKIHHE